MPSEERTQELIKGLYDAVVNMDEEAAADLSQTILREGLWLLPIADIESIDDY